MKLIINGKPVELSEDNLDLTYNEIVALALGKPYPEYTLTVTYACRRKGNSRRSGELTKGKRLVLEDGMVIDIRLTDNA